MSVDKASVKCLMCPKHITAKEMREHLHEHFGYKPFKCNDCDFECILRSDLDQHAFDNEHRGGPAVNPYLEGRIDLFLDDTQFAAKHGMVELLKRESYHSSTPSPMRRHHTVPANRLSTGQRRDDAAAASGEQDQEKPRKSIIINSQSSSSSDDDTSDDFFDAGVGTDGSALSTPHPSPSKPLQCFATPVAGEKTERTLALEDTVETAAGTPSIRRSATVATVPARSTVPFASSPSPPTPTKKITEEELEEEVPIDNTAPAAPLSTVSVVIDGEPANDEESRPQPFDELKPAVGRAGSEAASVSSSALLAAVPFPMPHRQVSLGSICRSPKKEPEEEEPINEEKEQADAAQPPETDAAYIKKEIKKGSQGSQEFEGFTPPRWLPQQDDQKPAVDGGDAEDDNDVGMEGGEGGAEDGEDGVGDDERTTRKRSATTPPPVPIKKGRKSRKGGKKATAASSGEKARKGVCTLCSREYSSTSGAYKTHARAYFPHLLPYSCVICKVGGATKESIREHYLSNRSCKKQAGKRIGVDCVEEALLECKVKECFPDLHVEPTPSREAEFRCDLCPSSTCPVNVDHLCYHIVSEHADLEAIKMNDDEYISAIRRLFPGAHCVHKIKRYFTVTK